MYTPKELEELRQMSLEAMDAEATVYGARPPKEYGQPQQERPELLAGVPCRVVEVGSGSESVRGGERATVAPYLVQLDGAQEVPESGEIRVEWKDKQGAVLRSQRYSVVRAAEPVSYQVNTRVHCTKAE